MKHIPFRYHGVALGILIGLILLLRALQAYHYPRVAEKPAARVPNNVMYYLEPTAPNVHFPPVARQNPFVRTPPYALLYPLVYFLEQKDTEQELFNATLLSEKRLVELERWGNDLPVLKKTKTAKELRSWWNNAKPGLFSFGTYSNLSSWEAGLARYDELLERQRTILTARFSEPLRQEELHKLHRTIRLHRDIFADLLKNSNKDFETKQYLQQLFDEISNTISHTIFADAPRFDPNRIPYSFDELIAQKQQGSYRFTLDWPPAPDETIATTKVLYNGQSILPGSTLDVRSPTDTMSLTFPQQNIVEGIQCSQSRMIAPYKLSKTFYIFIQHQPSNLIYTIEERKGNKYEDLSRVVLSTTRKDYEALIELPKDKRDASLRFRIYPETPDDACPEKPVSVTLSPVFTPNIILDKINSHPSPPPKQTIYYPYRTRLIGLGQLALQLLSILYGAYLMIALVTSRYKLQMNAVVSWITKLRFLFFILAVGGIFFDIIGAPRSRDSFIIPISILWLLSTVGYRHSIWTHVRITAAMLCLVPLLIIFKREFLAEKFAVWGFTFLLFSFFQMLIEQWYKPHKQMDTREFIVSLAHMPLIRHSWKRLTPAALMIWNYSKHLYREYIRPPARRTPETLKPYLIRLAGFMAVVMVIGALLLLTIVMVRKQIYNWVNQRALESRTPHISKVEPRFVYHGTKVIVWGREFGWANDKKNILKSKFGPVSTHLWTDQKIIFTVPLHWKPGELTLWVEKPTLWDGKEKILHGNQIKIKALPITSHFTADDEIFYEEMKKYDPETRKINGFK